MSFFRRYRVPVAAFAVSAAFMIGGVFVVRALSDGLAQPVPDNGRLHLDCPSGNRAYSVWHKLPGKPVVKVSVTESRDGKPVDVITPERLSGAGNDSAEGMRLAGSFDALKEGGYDIAVTGLSGGDVAMLVEETAFKWIIPAFVCSGMAFAFFLVGVLSSVYLARRPRA